METNQPLWEQFWANVDPAKPSAVIWGVTADVAAKNDVPKFIDKIDQSLPMIDFGCGHGLQSMYLATVLPRVIGTDVSEAALEKARQATQASNLEFRQLDGFNPEAAVKLHAETGDANVYLRLTLHQFPANVRPAAGQVLRTLMGKKGSLYFVELTDSVHQDIGAYMAQYGRLPDTIQRVMEIGMQPGIVTPNDIEELFPSAQYEHVLRGTMDLQTNQILPDGTPWVNKNGALYGLIRAR